MITSPKTAMAAVAAATTVGAFAPQSFVSRSRPGRTSTSELYSSTVDPATITKKEYQDICGVDFDDKTMAERLAKTAYLYPKHVEVIDDFAPMVDKMVDEIVSGHSDAIGTFRCRCFACVCLRLLVMCLQLERVFALLCLKAWQD